MGGENRQQITDNITLTYLVKVVDFRSLSLVVSSLLTLSV